jgi:hypothetical protein
MDGRMFRVGSRIVGMRFCESNSVPLAASAKDFAYVEFKQ